MPEKGQTKRQLLSDRINSLLLCMQSHELQNPPIMPQLPLGVYLRAKGHTESIDGDKNRKTSLADIFGDNWREVKYFLLEETSRFKIRLEAKTRVIIEHIVLSQKIPEPFKKDVEEALWLWWYCTWKAAHPSETKKIDGFPIELIRTKGGFDKLVEQEQLSGNIFFATYDDKVWETIRSIYKKHIGEDNFYHQINDLFHNHDFPNRNPNYKALKRAKKKLKEEWRAQKDHYPTNFREQVGWAKLQLVNSQFNPSFQEKGY